MQRAHQPRLKRTTLGRTEGSLVMPTESDRSAPGVRRLALVLPLLIVLSACTSREPPVAPEPAAVLSAVPASGTAVARVESREASEALRAYLDSWMRDFNVKAVGSETGTAPLDAATAVPLDKPNVITVGEYIIEPLARVSDERAAYRVAFSFMRGNPLSSAQPAQYLESTSTYILTRSGQDSAWVITLTSAAPESNLRPVPPPSP